MQTEVWLPCLYSSITFSQSQGLFYCGQLESCWKQLGSGNWSSTLSGYIKERSFDLKNKQTKKLHLGPACHQETMRETQHTCSTVPSFSPCLLLFLLYGKFPYAFELLVSFPQKDFFMEIPWSLDFLNFKKITREFRTLQNFGFASSSTEERKADPLHVQLTLWPALCPPRAQLGVLCLRRGHGSALPWIRSHAARRSRLSPGRRIPSLSGGFLCCFHWWTSKPSFLPYCFISIWITVILFALM